LARQAELYERVVAEIRRENDWIKEFQEKTMAELYKDRNDIEKEMDKQI